MGVAGDKVNRTFSDLPGLLRSGDAEYAINRVPCRLKDIVDLLSGTGATGSAGREPVGTTTCGTPELPLTDVCAPITTVPPHHNGTTIRQIEI